MTRKKDQSPIRRATETAADVAIGGPVLAAEKGREAIGETARALRKALDDGDSRPYEERTREELYALASEREIEGRSAMAKRELIAALRAQR